MYLWKINTSSSVSSGMFECLAWALDRGRLAGVDMMQVHILNHGDQGIMEARMTESYWCRDRSHWCGEVVLKFPDSFSLKVLTHFCHIQKSCGLKVIEGTALALAVDWTEDGEEVRQMIARLGSLCLFQTSQQGALPSHLSLFRRVRVRLAYKCVTALWSPVLCSRTCSDLISLLLKFCKLNT